MSEEKLTVAELLARARKDAPEISNTQEQPRRRRRRSLDEGGISVAELTGSIPKVQADGPRRGSHALKSEAEEFDEGLNSEVETSAVEEAQPTKEAAESDADGATEERNADVAAVAAESPEAEARVAESRSDEVVESEESLDDVALTGQRADGATKTEISEEEPQSSQLAVHALPLALPKSARPVTFHEGRSEITYTFTELMDARNPEQPVAKPGPVAREILDGSLAYDDRPTSTIPVVTVPAEESIADVEARPADGSITEVDPVTEEAPEVFSEEQPTTEHKPAVDSVPIAVAKPVSAEPEVAPVQRGKDSVDKPQAAAVAASRGAKSSSEDAEPINEDNSLSIALLIIQVFVGLLVGALVFLGFTFAWDRLPAIVVVVLAVVVTGLLVLGANMVRRKRDVATPVLVGIVGLALTFGPWLLFSL